VGGGALAQRRVSGRGTGGLGPSHPAPSPPASSSEQWHPRAQSRGGSVGSVLTRCGAAWWRRRVGRVPCDGNQIHPQPWHWATAPTSRAAMAVCAHPSHAPSKAAPFLAPDNAEEPRPVSSPCRLPSTLLVAPGSSLWTPGRRLMWLQGTLLLDAWRDGGGEVAAVPLAALPGLLLSLPLGRRHGPHGGGAAASSDPKTTRTTE
jgi:hypothetical protein